MHGRLKVKTTAQQEAEKDKERAKKAILFQEGMKLIFENRGNKEKDDTVLSVSHKLLSANPDVYTLWNIRKEILLKKCEVCEAVDDSIFRVELDLTQNCLHVNPKSYGAWNHRRYVMNIMKNPDWHEEVRLCNIFLQFDSRNFHCWDYRRFVVLQAHLTFDDELSFTTKKITENFSNYSAWHNRSQLYKPTKNLDVEDSRTISDLTLKKELEIVQNAVYTDPSDQSAWFYQRWLLGRKKSTPCLLSLSLYYKGNVSRMVAAFSQPVSLTSENTNLKYNGQHVCLNWETCMNLDKDSKFDYVWTANILQSFDSTVQMTFEGISSLVLTLVPDKEKQACHLKWSTDKLSGDDDSSFLDISNTAVEREVLQKELESCQMLYEEEPQNKWTMLTMLFLMNAISVEKHLLEMDELIEKLLKVDALRVGYYQDFRSKYRIENKLRKLLLRKDALEVVDLSNMELTSLPYFQYFTCCTRLDLRGNCFQNNHLANLPGVDILIDIKH